MQLSPDDRHIKQIGGLWVIDGKPSNGSSWQVCLRTCFNMSLCVCVCVHVCETFIYQAAIVCVNSYSVTICICVSVQVCLGGYICRAEWGLYEGCIRAVWGLYEGCMRSVSGLYEDCLRSIWGLYEVCIKAVWGLLQWVIHRALEVISSLSSVISPALRSFLKVCLIGTLHVCESQRIFPTLPVMRKITLSLSSTSYKYFANTNHLV